MYWVHDLSPFVLAVLVVGGIVLISLVGMAVTRPLARRFFGPSGHNEVVGDVLQAAGAFYGITLGLITVGAWSASGDAQNKVANEAAELAALYRDVSCLPEPAQYNLHSTLRKYTRYLIDDAWPEHRKGRIPQGGTFLMDEFVRTIKAVKPADQGEQVMMAEVFTQFNRFYGARRQRLQAMDGGMPGVLWGVVFAGAGVTIGLMFCFVIEKFRVHLLFVGLISGLIGLLIFITVQMDNPFRGSSGIGPEPYELAYEQLMKD